MNFKFCFERLLEQVLLPIAIISFKDFFPLTNKNLQISKIHFTYFKT